MWKANVFLWFLPLAAFLLLGWRVQCINQVWQGTEGSGESLFTLANAGSYETPINFTSICSQWRSSKAILAHGALGLWGERLGGWHGKEVTFHLRQLTSPGLGDL